MHFVIHKAQGGGFFFTIYGGNNEKLCHSEVYNQKQSAVNTINVIKNGAATAPVYDRT